MGNSTWSLMRSFNISKQQLNQTITHQLSQLWLLRSATTPVCFQKIMKRHGKPALVMFRQEPLWTQALLIDLLSISTYAAIMGALGQASQRTTMCCMTIMGSHLMSCRDLSTIFASPLLGAPSQFPWSHQSTMQTSWHIEGGSTMKSCQTTDHLHQHHLLHHCYHHIHLCHQHQLLLTMSSSLSYTEM